MSLRRGCCRNERPPAFSDLLQPGVRKAGYRGDRLPLNAREVQLDGKGTVGQQTGASCFCCSSLPAVRQIYAAGSQSNVLLPLRLCQRPRANKTGDVMICSVLGSLCWARRVELLRICTY